MKQLQELLTDIHVLRLTGTNACVIRELQSDSRQVEPGDLFVAVRGITADGHRFIPQAIALGALVIVCENLPATIHETVTYVQVENTAIALGYLASNFFGRPSEFLKLIGITGTNGKTTTATLLYQLVEDQGYRSGLISTIRNKIHHKVAEATHTTPDPIQLNRLIRQMVDDGCAYCFMEVSSHAADQHRIAGLTFSGGVFTNITHDHLDYHKTFDSYIKAKKSFFDGLSPESFALVNKDDKHGMVMLQNCRAKKYTYSLTLSADFRCKVIENTLPGLHLAIGGKEAWFRLIGRFNAYNLLVAYAVATLLGKDQTAILTGLSRLSPVEGRFNYIVSPENITAIVDYAHTPDALQNVLETINEIRQDEGNLITVVGAGGNRDTTKRPVMANIACRFSDRVILTSDNPRFEEPEAILEEMKKGVPEESLPNVLVIVNRKEAIKTACALAGTGDTLLVAGKGHETYQEIKGVKFPFDDLKVLREILGVTQTEHQH